MIVFEALSIGIPSTVRDASCPAEAWVKVRPEAPLMVKPFALPEVVAVIARPRSRRVVDYAGGDTELLAIDVSGELVKGVHAAADR